MELQEHERALHPSRLPGEEIADAHLDWILHQAERDGIVLVAECDERFVGFVAGWVQQIAVIAETADSNRFGYISDIYVMPSYRGRQIAVQLLNAIEQYLRGYGIALLRINTLAANVTARRSYERAGFFAYEILYAKCIDPDGKSVIEGQTRQPVVKQMEEIRRRFADELRFVANLRSPAVVRAFATVPRERFVGPGPWRIRSPMDRAQYWTTEDADPRHVYHDALIALDETRGLNNGQPSLWASLLDALNITGGEHVLHLGCGTGYYSAIIAELVGLHGRVTALEIDATLAARACGTLEPWPQAEVLTADGALYRPGAVDLIVASAGATHPLPVWLDALHPGGRLMLPLTMGDRGGVMLLATRQCDETFAARLLRPVGFIAFAGARDPDAEQRLGTALRRRDIHSVNSLRRDPHPEDDTCWLHGEGWCLSRRGAAGRPLPPRCRRV